MAPHAGHPHSCLCSKSVLQGRVCPAHFPASLTHKDCPGSSPLSLSWSSISLHWFCWTLRCLHQSAGCIMLSICVCVCVFSQLVFESLRTNTMLYLSLYPEPLGRHLTKTNFTWIHARDLPFPFEYLNSPPRQDKSTEQCRLLEQ